ncbi:MAG: YabP/YqfC family sporulation protein [Christensenellales bacterium]|jgi:sporulation protein YqfC|nr:hypothetical protein [Clostridiales bacterium]
MSVYNKLIVKLGLPLSDSVGGVKLCMVDFMCVLIEGHRGILKYTPQEITVRLKKGNIVAAGQGLTIEEINADEILIKGNIDSIKRDYDKQS